MHVAVVCKFSDRPLVSRHSLDIQLQVEKRFPDKSVKLLVGCSTGTQYSIEALEALDEVLICS